MAHPWNDEKEEHAKFATSRSPHGQLDRSTKSRDLSPCLNFISSRPSSFIWKINDNSCRLASRGNILRNFFTLRALKGGWETWIAVAYLLSTPCNLIATVTQKGGSWRVPAKIVCDSGYLHPVSVHSRTTTLDFSREYKRSVPSTLFRLLLPLPPLHSRKILLWLLKTMVQGK